MTESKSKKAPEPKRVLGRGLDALLPVATASAGARLDSDFQRVPIERLRPQQGQPRKHFAEEALHELAESLRAQGMIQPIVARRAGDEFEIVAGERRWRAAQRAGLREVPVVLKDVTPAAAFELALVENLQRADLDPIETAEAYRRLMDEHGYTQETLAERVGKNRATVANTLRLLNLPGEVRQRLASGQLTEGHARALLSCRDAEQMKQLAQKAAEKQWTVRDTEAAARKGAAPAAEPTAPAKPARNPNPNARDLEKRLAAALGMSVVIREDAGKKSGVVELGYDSLDQLDRFLDRVLGD